ncbi:MAG TPA: hypothetical protein PKJ69_08485 [Spirochaetota bacterium]|nr:hypothetical protein [Spirochaetota bacterium]
MDYYQLKPALMLCDFNFEMIMTIKSSEDNQLNIDGNFRTNNDFGGMKWNSVDNWGHPSQKYTINNDFSGVILSYNYNHFGAIASLNELAGQTLTVETTLGSFYYVRMWNYVVDRPVQDWEAGGGILFPEGRIPGSANGTSGNVVIDFDNLYAGWAAYEWNGLEWIESPSWVKVDQTEIKSLTWGFSPSTYTGGDKIPTGSSDPFSVIYSGWTVDGAHSLGSTTSLNAHLYRLADGFDDIYAATPERYIENFYDLGFREFINLYIGASHYYDKYGDPTKPTPGGYVSYQYYVINNPNKEVLNLAFKTYFFDFCKRAADKGFKLVIGSVSLEMVDALQAWWQLTADEQPATSGWTPTPYFVSFTNLDVQAFYIRYVQEVTTIQDDAGLEQCIQLGEPWWWNEGDKPCFYDASTKNKFLQDKGRNLPIYLDMWIKNYDEEALLWLQEQNGNFIEVIRNAVPDAKLAVLFFPPTVVDIKRVGKMMRIVNFPVNNWKNTGHDTKLDFFMIEDYDWVIDNDPMHNIVYNFTWENLKYQWFRTHYFAGFVLNSEPLTSALLKRVNIALIDGVNCEFRSYIWAGTQVRRDGWLPPDMVWKLKPAYLTNIRTLQKMEVTFI